MALTPHSAAPRRRDRLAAALLLAALAFGGSVTAANGTLLARAIHTGFVSACLQDGGLAGIAVRNERHLVSLQNLCASLTADGGWNGDPYWQPLVGGTGAGLEPMMCPRDSVARSVLVFEDSSVPLGADEATAVTRIALVCTDGQNRDTRVGADPPPGTFTEQVNLGCPPGQRVSGFRGGWGTQAPDRAPQLQVMRELEVTCTPLPAPRQPEPAPQMGGVQVSVALTVDVYDAPGDNPNRRVTGQLPAAAVVVLPEPCRADHWCPVVGAAVPGGSGWVWSGPEYDSLGRFAN